MTLRLAHDAPVEEFLKRDWVEVVRDGGAVKRCHTYRTIGEPRVDSHSWGVAVFVHRLDPEAPKELLLAALFHDIPEKWSGDVPADAKWREPGLKALLDRIEHDVHAHLGTGFEYSLSEADQFTLKVADRLELLWHCLEQRRLGNQYADLVFDRVSDWFDTVHDRLSFPGVALLRDVRGYYASARGGNPPFSKQGGSRELA